MLLELLEKGLIKTNVIANNREEAIEIAGNLMVEKNFVKDTYVEAMKEMSADMPGYIVIAPGVAMPHARSESGVNEICASLLTLKNPVVFGSEENDPVELVIAIAATDNTSHLRLLQDIAHVFDDEELIGKMKHSQNEQELLDLIKDKMEEEENV